MMKSNKYFAYTLSILLIAYGLHFYFKMSGSLTQISAPELQQCEKIYIVPGTEDLLVDRSDNFVFVSAYDRRSSPKMSNKKDGIYGFSFDNPSQVLKLTTNEPTDFHPHGISFL